MAYLIVASKEELASKSVGGVGRGTDHGYMMGLLVISEHTMILMEAANQTFK